MAEVRRRSVSSSGAAREAARREIEAATAHFMVAEEYRMGGGTCVNQGLRADEKRSDRIAYSGLYEGRRGPRWTSRVRLL